MDQSLSQESPPAPEAGERRGVRRRLVQSTLFSPKAQDIEAVGVQNNEQNCSEGEGDEDDEACGSQKKRRKRRGKVATPKRNSSAKKDKRQLNSTPKKNGTTNGMKGVCSTPKSIKLVENEVGSPPIPNLRMEAKLRAEENSRMFAGRQIHPFFSSWRSDKKCQEATEIEGNPCSSDRKSQSITLCPIHVFEKTEDDGGTSLDWRSWIFNEETFSGTHSCLESTSSFFEGAACSLTFDKFHCVPHHAYNKSPVKKEVSWRQSRNQQLNHEPAATHEADICDEKLICCHFKGSTLDHEINEVGSLSECSACLGKSDPEQHHEERTPSTNDSSRDEPPNTLWTNKYQPKNSMEVCGNSEAVKFLTEWLRLWHQADYKNIKNLDGVEESSLQYDYYVLDQSDSESERKERHARLKNVLLVTGPVGCGKSAAIYACAEEQGFEVMEVNASECRNGALMKQKFGEALESHLLKWSTENQVDIQTKSELCSAADSGKAEGEGKTELIESIQLSDEENPYSAGAVKLTARANGASCHQAEVKPLILFEDVDITFLDDRGFIAAIQHIAETAKGPLILTSSSCNLLLPDNMERLETCFTAPSVLELLCHVHMVCGVEKMRIQPHLVQKFVGCCEGDIRKTIMNLQFWCQGNEDRKGGDVRGAYGPVLFDLESGHKILPKLMPWDFPSELCELIEKEISNSLTPMQDNSFLLGTIDEHLEDKEVQCPQRMDQNEIDLQAKKEAMLRRNCSMYDDEDLTIHFATFDSEDETFNHGYVRPMHEESPMVNSGAPAQEREIHNCFAPLGEEQCPCGGGEAENCLLPRSIMGINLQMTDPCKSLDESCVPESSFVPETEIDDGIELSSRTYSCRGGEMGEPYFDNGLASVVSPVKNGFCVKPLSRLRRLSDMLANRCDMMEDSSHGVGEDSQLGNVEAVDKGYQLMDECSRVDFNESHRYQAGFRIVSNSVRESWKRLREQLKNRVTKHEKDAFQMVQIASRISNLISEADLLRNNCQSVIDDYVDPTMVIAEEPESFSRYNEQWQMTSTFVQHGLCSFAKDIPTVGSENMCQNGVDLAYEMLALTSNRMAVAKLIIQDMGGSKISDAVMDTPDIDVSRRKTRTSLFDVIESVGPSKLYLYLRDNAFYDYLSSLGKISKAETARLSGCINKKRRRGRASRHYLSNGALMLSPEHISLLQRCNSFGNNTAQVMDNGFR
ncbi:uncharacterized protein LOC115734760 isoform X2 [Rhodamnia argentea]|uniref:Uncharacterized protein LOC115734760 isoform X2 n=1 Tax=Rhodamnia argentea TaxID=178133 RepID=A0ABM3H3M0_9MYRT|nr:uncharacterized protein LOC115734760 isoform X2 [Rhodamnia argentea]